MTSLKIAATALVWTLASVAHAKEIGIKHLNPSTDGRSALEFVEKTLPAMFAIPANKDGMHVLKDVFYNEDVWQKFLKARFLSPNVGLTVLPGLSVTYTFADPAKKVDGKPLTHVYFNDDEPTVMRVGFHVFQHVSISGKELKSNCFAGDMTVLMPKGIHLPNEAKLKDFSMVMVPPSFCGIGSNTNGKTSSPE